MIWRGVMCYFLPDQENKKLCTTNFALDYVKVQDLFSFVLSPVPVTSCVVKVFKMQ